MDEHHSGHERKFGQSAESKNNVNLPNHDDFTMTILDARYEAASLEEVAQQQRHLTTAQRMTFADC